MARYLVDTSVFARVSKPRVATAFLPLVARGDVILCHPVSFELRYAARNHRDYRSIAERLASFPAVPVTDADHRRALEVQQLLSAKGHHRALSLVDALVAAIAEARDLTVLHYDADFELVSAVTGQRHQWIVNRGTAD
jgi:predicted nucleic acid-binding protein